jgi:hypothetical protein
VYLKLRVLLESLRGKDGDVRVARRLPTH